MHNIGRRLRRAAPLASASTFASLKSGANDSLETNRLHQQFSRTAPFFPHTGAARVIESPSEFYSELLRGIDRSQKRIVLSSLYLGAGDQSRVIVKKGGERGWVSSMFFFFLKKNKQTNKQTNKTY